MEKKCNKCKKQKPMEEFRKSKRYKDGKRLECKKCEDEYQAQRRQRQGPFSEYKEFIGFF